jgi:hypothetical protein
MDPTCKEACCRRAAAMSQKGGEGNFVLAMEWQL